MKARVLASALAVASIAALALPGGASAATRTLKIPATTYESASLRGSNGFRVELLLGPGFADVVASKRFHRRTFQTTSYTVRGPKGRKNGVVDEKIGRYGKFRGRFVARSIEHEADDCKGGPVIVEKGFYVGSFAFRGTDDFTRATGHRMPGSITRDPAEVCREPSAPKSLRERKHGTTKEEGTEVRLNVATKSGDATFLASQTTEPLEGSSITETNFTASAYRHSGRVTISSFLFSFFDAKPSTFVDPEPHTEATITPAAPFSGSATFKAEGPKKSSWTGNLSVELPGFGRVALTGKKFIATVEEGPVDNSGYFGGLVTTNVN